MLSLITIALAALPAVFGEVFDVSVGKNGALAFEPSTVSAVPGDVINFVFHPKNHTATQSTFTAPCSPLEGGARSGFIPVEVTEAFEFPNFPYVVVDTEPKWWYCGQGTHCSAAGMVFALNAPAEGERTFEAFQSAARGGAPPPTAPSVPVPEQSAPAVSSPAASAPAPTSTETGVVYKVIVGKDGGLTYDPSEIKAVVGDSVEFTFVSGAHTITRSSFAAPCTKLGDVSLAFDSGPKPAAAAGVAPVTYTVNVTDTKPIWAYCATGAHCAAGMVFAINPVEPNTFSAFQAAAKGTASGSGSSSAPSPSSTNAPASGASTLKTSIGSVAAVAAFAAFLL